MANGAAEQLTTQELRAGSPPRPAGSPMGSVKGERATMMGSEELFQRVRARLRAGVGEDVFTSWFARLELEEIVDDLAHLSVPTRFLKSWIQSHYSDRVLRCWQAEERCVQRIELTVRTAAIKMPMAKPTILGCESASSNSVRSRSTGA